MKVLEVKNLVKKFKDKIVLDNVSLEIEKGKIVALVGPNGVGKTTLMKCIAGLIAKDEGTIEIDGISIKENREKYLSKFSSVIENPSLYENISGYDNVKFIANLNNISKEEVDKIIDFINIKDSINKKVSTYSLGMKQRLVLGICLLTKPKLLILDEPTNGIDPSASMELKKLLKKLSRDNETSILISSHILSDLDSVCDEVIYMKEGKIVQVNNKEILDKNIEVVFTFENITSQLELIKSKEYVQLVEVIDENKLGVKIEKTNLSILLEDLALNRVLYKNIDIIEESIDKDYKKIYGGRVDE